MKQGEDIRQLGFQYQSLPDGDKGPFFKKHGVRWSELFRLPYFNPVTQCTIDPLHNLLLGMSESPNRAFI